MADEDDDSKQHEPTQKKLDDARKRGEVPRSSDLNTAMSYMVLLLLATALGASTMTGIGTILASMIERSDQLAHHAFHGQAGPVLANAMTSIAWRLTPWLVLPMIAVLGLSIVTRSFVVSPEKLMPKLNRISPLSNAKNKFGRSGLFEFFKSFVKLSIYGVILGVFIWVNLPEMLAALALTPGMVSVLLMDLSIEFFAIVLLVAMIIGGIDYLWQHQEHLRKNRMSHKELMDEIKQNEGDPHMKGQRRQKAYDIATNQMMQDVPDADVIVVNPTHYAVALKWSRLPGEAPICVAKGVDEVAARIREIASENGVPIHRDPPTARALHATVEIGREIPSDQYQAVAAAIRFAEKMRQRAKKSFRS
ncbi:flagellar biosynthetic protein FlhB [Aliiroseovarius halocynthiae]|uniref:Flagellar biosynthesis protein FlhB n=1 Tax=Aliiroseovarius halocynthiae TaxID=985055 RepID=A0A545SYG9_9RHOB|nr:flagellar type III secretion system protein FlhB [Aliiroseovarius halocynthiae]TQV70015.1 flagellar biosynthesis protein FlhB [Aliiroseovarius halocynthiae]SMR70683.1 flagellar biosynthetic protein FlhB [Aliiroseovarius halocynthiae]